MALRALLNEHESPEDAAAVQTRLEERLGVPVSVPNEPPVDDWGSVLPPGTITAACQQLRDRIDDIVYGYAHYAAAHALLDFIEDRKGWQRSFATPPQVELDADGNEL